MDRPPLVDAPLFAYGALKPSEFAHAQVATHVSGTTPAMLDDHALRSRDGLPLLVESPGAAVRGALLRFHDAQAAYAAVCQFEPRKHYRWVADGVTVLSADGEIRANTLLARRPDSGADLEHIEEWSTADDPVFTVGLPTAAQIAQPWCGRRTKRTISHEVAYFMFKRPICSSGQRSSALLHCASGPRLIQCVGSRNSANSRRCPIGLRQQESA